MPFTLYRTRKIWELGHTARKRFRASPLKIKRNFLALQILVIHFFKHSIKIGRAYFEIDKQNGKTLWKTKIRKILKQKTNDLFKTDSLDHLCKKSPDYSSNCNKNKSLLKKKKIMHFLILVNLFYVNLDQLSNNQYEQSASIIFQENCAKFARRALS